MSRTKRRPEYLLHKATGQARVRINGKDSYLGAYGSPASRERYEELIDEWFARNGDTSRLAATIDDLCIRFQQHADEHYRKNGEPTSEAYNIRLALRHLIGLYGETRARDFGPRALKAVRQSMIDAGCVRTSINRMVGRMRRMFLWAVAEELLPGTIHQALSALPGLEAGRSAARLNPNPVRPVPEAYVDAIPAPTSAARFWGA